MNKTEFFYLVAGFLAGFFIRHFFQDLVKESEPEETNPLSPKELESNPKLLHKIVKERQEIKDSIKKNFPREWRDRFERSPGGHSVTGPFNSLLSKMNINSSNFNETAISRPSSPSQRQRSPSPPRKGTPKFSIAAAGSNQLKRYKVKNQTDSIPVREGVVLGLPKTNSISVPKINITNELPDF
jgi:hypothetical protein